MRATDLAPEIWNAIADEIRRQQSSREIFFVKVTKVDKKKKLVWANDFGSMAIPLVSHNYSFSYYDTNATGAKIKVEDTTQENPALRTEIVMPKVGQTIVVLDAWGAKRFPICVGVILSKPGFWEEG